MRLSVLLLTLCQPLSTHLHVSYEGEVIGYEATGKMSDNMLLRGMPRPGLGLDHVCIRILASCS